LAVCLSALLGRLVPKWLCGTLVDWPAVKMEPSQASSSSSRPSVHLPVRQSQADESQGGASTAGSAAHPPKSPIVDTEERDLFGSSSDEDATGPGAPAAHKGAAPLPGSAPLGQTAAERDLLGDEDDLSEKDLFGTDDEGGVDEQDLFGSDSEAEAAPPGSAPAATVAAIVPAQDDVPQPPSRASTMEPSEMDEEDIFGRDLSDDEVADERKELEDVVLRKRPMPSAGRKMAALRIPNILTIEKKPFNPLKFSEDVRNGYKQFKSTQSKDVFRLMNPENVVRWRFKKSEEGQILTSDDGRPQYESNSRVVEWDDGSRTLFVGSESFQLNDLPDNVLLFEENTQEVSVCHGFIESRFVATPRSLESKTHEHVKRAQFNKYEPTSRSLLINTEDQAFLQQQQALELEQRLEKEKREKKMLKAGEDMRMNAAFLESDSDNDPIGPSVKRQKL